MPAVSKKQQRFFGYLLSNPEERKKKGISKKAAKDFASDVQEVSPPGWGHTKAEKEKTKPDKPKSKIGGSAAAFDRARKEGRFKGSKEDMFKLMWWMKNKGGKPRGKPHYKPGTDEKKEKYQDESFDIDKSEHRKAQKKAKLRNLAKGNMNPNEKDAAEKKAGGPKLAFEGWKEKAGSAIKRALKKKDAPKHDYGRDAGAEAKKRLRKKDHEKVNFLDPDD